MNRHNCPPSRITKSGVLRRGAILPLGILLILMIMAFGVLIVDIGHLYSAKSNLNNSANAASYAGALMLKGQPHNLPAIRNSAIDFADLNVPGTENILTRGNVETGLWDFTTQTFRPSPAVAANAVRVTVRRIDGQSKSVPTMLGQLVGKNSVGIESVSISAFRVSTNNDGTIVKSRVKLVR
ncbi:MAG: TadG family pilus assembly protein [Pirellulaceae bacterium]|nr:TadG family pilus assembly protein [Pirellulaceae bacterium]